MNVTVIVAIIVALSIFLPFWLIFRSRRRQLQLIKTGTLGIAKVFSISQTGVTINSLPQMKLVLDIEQAGMQQRRVTFKQLIDLGSIPRAGDRVYILSDPKNPDHVILSPSVRGSGLNVVDQGTGETINMDSDLVRDVIGLSPQLRERGKAGIAIVVAVSPTTTSASQIVLDIDAIGIPRRRVTIAQVIEGPLPVQGQRIYILVDSTDPNVIALIPPSMLNGQSIPYGSNRLDAVVLGPQILKEGSKAKGKVITSIEIQMGNPVLAARGFSKWQMTIEVTPDNDTASYIAPLTISLTSREKAARLTPVGAELLMRYDPLDLQTIAIDSEAMGYENPYAELQRLFYSNVKGS